jgi:hypothetical protein
MILAPLLLFFAPQEIETADSIMAKVAENQDRAEKMRTAYLYRQNVLVRMNHTNGKLAREQYSEYIVTPTEGGTRRKRTLFRGKYQDHGKIVEYDDTAVERRFHFQISVDSEETTDLSGFFGSSGTKDGVDRDMFPLTAEQQKNYSFHLEGTEDYRGTAVYRITFEPGKDGGAWAGEALIDRKEFQPVLVTTHQSFRIPLMVRTVLGTNLEHMGFKVTYRKFDEGLWFPITYGGELKIRGLFFYARRIGISLVNSDFQKTAVDSSVTYKQAPQ